MKNNSLSKGDYVVATKWQDADPNDHWCVGFYDRMLPKKSGDRYMIHDSQGHQFRQNGFRWAKKISKNRGEFLLNMREEIENSKHSIKWWLRKPMNITRVMSDD